MLFDELLELDEFVLFDELDEFFELVEFFDEFFDIISTSIFIFH